MNLVPRLRIRGVVPSRSHTFMWCDTYDFIALSLCMNSTHPRNNRMKCQPTRQLFSTVRSTYLAFYLFIYLFYYYYFYFYFTAVTLQNPLNKKLSRSQSEEKIPCP